MLVPDARPLKFSWSDRQAAVERRTRCGRRKNLSEDDRIHPSALDDRTVGKARLRIDAGNVLVGNVRHELNQTFSALNTRKSRGIVFGNLPFSGHAADWKNVAQQRPVNRGSNQSEGRTGEDKNLPRRKGVKTTNENRFQKCQNRKTARNREIFMNFRCRR